MTGHLSVDTRGHASGSESDGGPEALQKTTPPTGLVFQLCCIAAIEGADMGSWAAKEQIVFGLYRDKRCRSVQDFHTFALT